MLMTTGEIREHLETDLPDGALTRLIADADQAIVDAHGPHDGPITVTDEGGHESLWLPRPLDPDQPVTLNETVGTTTTALAADDWRTGHGGRQLQRLATGTNRRSRWGDRIEITYTPADQTDRRRRVLVDLVQLALTYRGLDKHTTVGDTTHTGPTTPEAYERERQALLGSLATGLRLR